VITDKKQVLQGITMADDSLVCRTKPHARLCSWCSAFYARYYLPWKFMENQQSVCVIFHENFKGKKKPIYIMFCEGSQKIGCLLHFISVKIHACSRIIKSLLASFSTTMSHHITVKCHRTDWQSQQVLQDWLENASNCAENGISIAFQT